MWGRGYEKPRRFFVSQTDLLIAAAETGRTVISRRGSSLLRPIWRMLSRR